MGLDAHRWSRQVSLAAIAVGIIALLLGFVGYLEHRPEDTTLDALYHSAVLLFGAYQPVGSSVPPILEAARFLALLAPVLAIVAVIGVLFHGRWARWRAGRARPRTVVVGDGLLAEALARGYADRGTDRIVLVGDRDESTRMRGMRTIPTTPTGQLAPVVRGAERLLVALGDDERAIALLGELRMTEALDGVQVRLVLDSGDLAAQLGPPLLAAAGDAPIDACSVSGRIAARVLQDLPPREEGTVGPPPVVIGSGDLAEQLCRRIALGWRRPAEEMALTVVAPHGATWPGDLAHELRDEVRLTTILTGATVGCLRSKAREGLTGWTKPEGAGDRRAGGARIYIADLPDVTARPLATLLASDLPTAHICCIVRDRERWDRLVEVSPASDQRGTGSEGLHVVALDDLERDPGIIELDTLVLLAEALVADRLHWRDDVEAALPPPSLRGRTVGPHLDDLDAPTRATYMAVAKAIPSAVATAGLLLRHGASDVVLVPQELTALATCLLPALRRSDAFTTLEADDASYAALELAAQLPNLLQRVGVGIVRPVGSPSLLTEESIERMAEAAHDGYGDTAASTNNASGSPLAHVSWNSLDAFTKESNRAQARDVVVKVAAVGRELRHLSVPPIGEAWITEVVDHLAAREHRRWEHLMRQAGWRPTDSVDVRRDDARRLHPHLRPYDELPPDVQEYDRAAVRLIPELLARVGLEAVPAPPRAEPQSGQAAMPEPGATKS